MACDYLTMRKTTLFRDGIKEMKMAHNQDLNTHVALWNLLIHGSYLPTFEDAFQKWLLSDGSGRHETSSFLSAFSPKRRDGAVTFFDNASVSHPGCISNF